MNSTIIRSFDETHLERICDVLADTDSGLKGSEIGSLLQQIGASDLEPLITKRKRLFAALRHCQDQDGYGNRVVAFIHRAMDPVRYTNNREVFNRRRDELNQVLVFSGYRLGEDGKLHPVPTVWTLYEAEERASKLSDELHRRGIHPDVLKFCRAELVGSNYFHAVLEATKGIADKIRQRSGLMEDGARLADLAFGLGSTGTPRLVFNSLQTESERNEQIGLMNLIKGVFSAYRNVTAHTPRVYARISEQDALDLLTLISLLHRRIDEAVLTERIEIPGAG